MELIELIKEGNYAYLGNQVVKVAKSNQTESLVEYLNSNELFEVRSESLLPIPIRDIISDLDTKWLKEKCNWSSGNIRLGKLSNKFQIMIMDTNSQKYVSCNPKSGIPGISFVHEMQNCLSFFDKSNFDEIDDIFSIFEES